MDTIEPDVDFAEEIFRAVAARRVLVAVIGPNWLSPIDARAVGGLMTPTTSCGWKSRPP